VKRLPFLDWTRGVAVLIMIECHTFNSLVRQDLRQSGPYVLSQFVGGMAAVLFLFLAGMTFAFQMDRLDRREAGTRQRVLTLLRRAGYILLLAYLFRINNSLMGLPHPPWRVLWKVDILNSMGAGMALLAGVGLLRPLWRARAAALAGLAIAAASPLISALDWSGVPAFVRNYVVPNRAAFPLFPWSAYLAFGVAAGVVLRRIAPDRMERTMQWAVLVGFGLVFGGQYFSNIPYSLYPKADFWLNSPALVIIRAGLVLLTLALAYVWTEHIAAGGWSWVECLGKTSLLVYWVHVLLVYGWLADAWRSALGIAQAVAVTSAVILLMLGLSVAKLRWSARRATPPVAQAVVAAVD
jgi:uncharacterized membrane protein